MKHLEHILSSSLREAYTFLYTKATEDPSFDVKETGPGPKRDVQLHYAGRRAYPFAFIVNSGERKQYHLFYIRNPLSGDLEKVKASLDESLLGTNSRGEITVQIADVEAAAKIWHVVQAIKLR